MPDGIERQLSLDVSNALSSIGDINDAFLATVATFEAGLDSALAVLGSVTVGDVDTSAVDAALVASIETASATPAVIDGDASAVTDAIGLSIASADNTFEVLADTGAIPPDIEAAIASVDTTINAAVVADISDAEEAVNSITAEPVELEVTANTEDAQTAIDSLSDTSSGATGAVENLEAATEGFSAASEGALGNASGLVSAVGTLSKGAGAASAGVVALGGFITETFNAAANAESVTRRFERSLGGAATALDHIDVGGLNTNLHDLAIETGSSVQGLESASARLADLGRSAGATETQIGDTVSTVDALAAQLAVTNPALGSTGEIADKLTSAFNKGGKSLLPFGISLNKSAIEAEALAETGKRAADELTVFDRVTAGANIRARELGDTLGTDVADGAEQAVIQARSLGVQLEETLIALGTPLISPVLELLEAALPAAQELGEAFATLATAALPAFTLVIGTTADALGLLNAVMDALPDGALAAAAAFAVVTGAVSILELAMVHLGIVAAGAFGPIGLVLGAAAAGASALGLFGDASIDITGPVFSLGNAVKSTSGDIKALSQDVLDSGQAFKEALAGTDLFGDRTESLRIAQQALGISTEDVRKALTGTEEDFNKLNKQFEDAVTGEDDFSVAAQKASSAISIQRSHLDLAAISTLREAVASGRVTQAQLDQAKARNTNRDGALDAISALADLDSQEARLTNRLALNTEALGNQASAWQELAASTLAGKTGLADVADVAARFGVEEDVVSQFITDISKSLDDFVSTATGALPTVKDAFSTFQTGISDASKALNDAAAETEPDAGKIADSFTALVEASDPQRLIENVQKQAEAIADFQGNVEAQLRAGNERVAQLLIEQGPVVGGALAQSLAEGKPKTAKELEGNLTIFQTAYDGYTSFIRDTGGPQVLTATGDWADSITGEVADNLDLTAPLADEIDKATKALGSTDIEKAAHANANRASQQFRDFITFQLDAAKATRGAGDAIEDNSPGVKTKATNAGTGGQKGFRSGFRLEDAASEAIGKVSGTIDTASETIKTSAHTAGQGIGDSFISGIELGMALSQARLINEGLRIVGNTVGAVRAGSKSFSPSLVFRDIGKDWIDGWVLGLQDDRVERRVADLTLAAVGAADARFQGPSVPQVSPGVLAGAGAGTVTIGSLVENLNLTMQNGTEAEARRVGGKIVDTISEELFRRGIAAEVRA